jgi:hypothetical protein
MIQGGKKMVKNCDFSEMRRTISSKRTGFVMRGSVAFIALVGLPLPPLLVFCAPDRTELGFCCCEYNVTAMQVRVRRRQMTEGEAEGNNKRSKWEDTKTSIHRNDRDSPAMCVHKQTHKKTWRIHLKQDKCLYLRNVLMRQMTARRIPRSDRAIGFEPPIWSYCPSMADSSEASDS